VSRPAELQGIAPSNARQIYGADGAAARLGLKPGTLQSKMRKLGIRRADYTDV